MKPENKKKAFALLKMLSVLYEKQVSGELLLIYWKALQDMTIEQLEKKVKHHIATSPFFPKPCDLIFNDADYEQELKDRKQQKMIEAGQEG